MAEVRRWRDTGNLERAVETAGGRDAFDAAMGAMLDEVRGWRLAEMQTPGAHAGAGRRADGRVRGPGAQIEKGDVSTRDVLAGTSMRSAGRCASSRTSATSS